jgi:hypothetical protein
MSFLTKRISPNLLISCSRLLLGLIYGEAVNASCAAARCGIGAVLVLVRRVPRRQSPGGALTGTHPIGMSHYRDDARGV